jgi:hypothetical protein
MFLLAISLLLVALALIAATNTEHPTPLFAALKSSHIASTVHRAATIRSEDRFVSPQNEYVKSMNGNGGISVFDPR